MCAVTAEAYWTCGVGTRHRFWLKIWEGCLCSPEPEAARSPPPAVAPQILPTTSSSFPCSPSFCAEHSCTSHYSAPIYIATPTIKYTHLSFAVVKIIVKDNLTRKEAINVLPANWYLSYCLHLLNHNTCDMLIYSILDYK